MQSGYLFPCRHSFVFFEMVLCCLWVWTLGRREEGWIKLESRKREVKTCVREGSREGGEEEEERERERERERETGLRKKLDRKSTRLNSSH